MMYLFISLLFLLMIPHSLSKVSMQQTISNPEHINGDAFFEILEPSELSYTYRIRPARNFGGQFNESLCLQNVKLVPLDPLDGCNPPLNAHLVEGNVAFAIRGSCSFLFKTLVAEEAGARAIIITEMETATSQKYKDSDFFIEMIDDQSDGDPSIPAGFLLGHNGGQILKILSSLRMPYALINIPINMTFVPLHKMNQPPWTSW